VVRHFISTVSQSNAQDRFLPKALFLFDEALK